MLIYSPNILKTYKTCPKKFYYQYIKKVNSPKFLTPFEKGKKIHALANYYLQGIDIKKIEQTLTDNEREIWTALKTNVYFQKKCLKSEYRIMTKISDYWIGGRLDGVMKDNKDYYILDYKTGAIPQTPKYDLQTMIYLICLSNILKEYNSLNFVYINLKQNTNEMIKFDEKSKEEYEKILIEYCKKIDNDKIYKPQPENCTNCEYKNLCK